MFDFTLPKAQCPGRPGRRPGNTRECRRHCAPSGRHHTASARLFGSSVSGAKARNRPSTSKGSPSAVPVPCASTRSSSPADRPACASAARGTRPGPGGWGRSNRPWRGRRGWWPNRGSAPDRIAVALGRGQRLEHHGGDPSPRRSRRPAGRTSCSGHRPRGCRSQHDLGAAGREDQVGAAGDRQRHSPLRRLWQARWTATRPLEQAVSTVRLGPCRFNK